MFSLERIKDETELIDFCRKKVLHGTPFIFSDNEDNYYEFRKRIAREFGIDFHEVFITGSAKLGFSPHKNKYFDYESDIDVAIVSRKLYEQIMVSVQNYQMNLRDSRSSISTRELRMYHDFLEYTAIGWIRPDKLPLSFQVQELKRNWFDFFDSLSYGKSEVGNYKVAAGIFKAYSYFEKYTHSSLVQVKRALSIGKTHDDSN